MKRRAPITALVSLLVATACPGVSAAQASAVAQAQAALDQDDRPVAIELLAARLADYPGDDEARFLYARVLAWDGRYDDSLAQYDVLLDASPDDADYLLGKARVNFWNGDADDSLVLLARARELAPDYDEIEQLQAQVIAAGQNPARFSYLEGGAGWQALSDDLPDWTEVYVRGGHRFGDRKELFGSLNQVERFGSRDTELRAGAVLPMHRKDALTLEASVAPGADVLPRWSLSGHWQRAFGRGWGAGLGWRHAEYEAATLDIVTLNGERYFADYRASATLYLSKLQGADLTFASAFRLDRYYRENNRVGLLFAVGRETESVGEGQFIENDTVTAALTGLHGLNEDWSLTWDLVVHDREEAWRRGGFRVGLRRDF